MSFLKDYLDLLKQTINAILLETQASIFKDMFQDANVTLHTISSPHV